MRIEVGGLSFSVVVDGPEDGPAVVLLHGWPDSSKVWRHQMPVLAEAGFRVVAPDLRGFGESDRPEGTAAYRAKLLCGDVVGILDALGVERATVVGHDWGAALAWLLASAFAPGRVERLAVLASGHPEAIRNAGPRQRQLSWYVLLFQFEGVAERWLTMDDWAHFREFCGGPDGYADVDSAIAELSRPGALTACLEWYRANMTAETLVAPPLGLPPVRLFHARNLGNGRSGPHRKTDDRLRQVRHRPLALPTPRRCGHWLQLAAPDRINALLLELEFRTWDENAEVGAVSGARGSSMWPKGERGGAPVRARRAAWTSERLVPQGTTARLPSTRMPRLEEAAAQQRGRAARGRRGSGGRGRARPGGRGRRRRTSGGTGGSARSRPGSSRPGQGAGRGSRRCRAGRGRRPGRGAA